jgi:hypothetical protein
MNFNFRLTSRLLVVLALLAVSTRNAVCADAPSPVTSTVVEVERPTAIQRFTVDPAAVRDMFSKGLKSLTGQSDAASAWKSLGVTSKDVVGIKITTIGGPLFSTHHPLVDEIIRGLIAAGVAPGHIIIWDKFEDEMISANWALHDGGPNQAKIMSIIPGAGFDPQLFYVNEVLGKLIWGDSQFQGKRPGADELLQAARDAVRRANPDGDGGAGELANPTPPAAPDQMSNKSFYTKIVTQMCTKIVNVPVLSDSTGVGINGVLGSLALGAVDNTRRFTGGEVHGDTAIPEILDKDFMRKKVILHVMDALVAQFAGGPRFTPNYTQSIGTLYISRDPVAIDSLVLPRLEAWRVETHVVPIGELGSHVKTAASYKLGEADPKKIKLIKLQ